MIHILIPIITNTNTMVPILTNKKVTSTIIQVQTEDQYQFCYRAALEYLSSFDHYTDN